VIPPAAALIVLAKAPEPGRAKTRLCPPATPAQAADLAAASLLDTLDAVAGVPGAASVVVLTGRLAGAVRASELIAALQGFRVLPQRGHGLGERIAAAHADTAALLPGRATLLVGMDTPQADAALLEACLERLRAPGTDAVLGPAADGGWWVLGLRDPLAAQLVADVPTSRDDTGERTLQALRNAGLRVGLLPELTDVDTAADAVAVAAEAPSGRFAAAVARCRTFVAVP
jgi:rSAM/selenodomain-associated transferase 1